VDGCFAGLAGVRGLAGGLGQTWVEDQRSGPRASLQGARRRAVRTAKLRHVGKLNTGVLWFFVRNRRIVAVHGIRNKGQTIPSRDLETAQQQIGEWRRRAEP
jgi:hypothetical protein